MVFSKSFPKRGDSRTYPEWIEITLTDEEEKAVEDAARKDNIRLLKECIDDAQSIVNDKKLKPFQNDLMQLAKTLFDKQASHVVFWKESKCKEKFDKLH
ncbi:MAG: hypothetical protein ABIH34_00890 [Nanoarchaeota archaeon]